MKAVSVGLIQANQIMASLFGFQVFDGLFQVAHVFLQFACHLIFQAFCLLMLATDKFAHFFLHFAADVFGCAFDLVFVHGVLSLLMEFTTALQGNLPCHPTCQQE